MWSTGGQQGGHRGSESLEMTSQTSSTSGQIRRSVVSFHKISYEISNRKTRNPFKKIHKKVIHDISGYFPPGMNAILGPSGCGKTTLLNILAGRKNPEGLQGRILVNGQRQPKNFKCLTGYVSQDDIIMGSLSVRENIMFSANLRLRKKMTDQQKQKLVNDVIEELGLTNCADSKVGNEFVRGISGGERKRTNIGMELIISPSFLFLDEPTTGLDASTANAVMASLRGLSRRGRTIIFSIHQPRYSIYERIDRLLLISEGHSVYHGPAKEALQYFSSIGLLACAAGYVCEQHNNPPDFFLDVINGDSTAVLFEETTTKQAIDNKEKSSKDGESGVQARQDSTQLRLGALNSQAEQLPKSARFSEDKISIALDTDSLRNIRDEKQKVEEGSDIVVVHSNFEDVDEKVNQTKDDITDTILNNVVARNSDDLSLQFVKHLETYSFRDSVPPSDKITVVFSQETVESVDLVDIDSVEPDACQKESDIVYVRQSETSANVNGNDDNNNNYHVINHDNNNSNNNDQAKTKSNMEHLLEVELKCKDENTDEIRRNADVDSIHISVDSSKDGGEVKDDVMISYDVISESDIENTKSLSSKLADQFEESTWSIDNEQYLMTAWNHFEETGGSDVSWRRPNRAEALYATPLITQLLYLSRRTLQNIIGSPHTTILQFVVMLFFGLVIGSIYFELDLEFPSGIQNKAGAFFFIIVAQMFGNMSAAEIFLKDRKIFIHENSSGFYRVSAYYLAKLCCDVIPMRFLPLLVFAPVSYFMMGLTVDVSKFFVYLLNLFLTTMTAASLGFLISASVTVSAIGSIVFALVYVTMVIFSGFLVNLTTMMPWISWLKYLSIIYYSINTFYVNEFEDQEYYIVTENGTIPLPGAGNWYLDNQGVPHGSEWDLWQNIQALTLITLGFLVATYVQLRRIQKRT